MIKYRRDDLLEHPLVKALITYKCKLANGIYAAFTLAYLVMVILATVFIVLSKPPDTLNWAVDACTMDNGYYATHVRPYTRWVQWCVWVLLAMFTSLELLQLAMTRFKYFRDPSNLCDWLCYRLVQRWLLLALQ